MLEFGDQAILSIDLDALGANWRRLRNLAPKPSAPGW